MRDRMQSRGPDDGTLLEIKNVVFAHRRLAIRDSDGGKQPVVSPNGRYVFTYNGEIYNDQQLRKELEQLGYRFHTRCDTEVLAAAWQAWQANCVPKLRGMFAFAVYDFAENQLSLVRDRFGIKPLFFAQLGPELVFASTIAAIRLHPKFSAQPNLATLRHYLSTLRLTFGEQTVFQGVTTVLPAEIVTYHYGRTTRSIYWAAPTADNSTDMDFAEAVDELEQTLRQAVSMRMVSDVPVGMMVSGGVDSNLLASLLRQESQKPFSAFCGGGDEPSVSSVAGDFEFANECAQHFGLDFGEVRLNADQYLDVWQQLVDAYETPVSTPTDVIINRLANALRNTVGVAMGGEGADEACCGYQVPHWSGADFELYRSMPSLASNRAHTALESLRKQYGAQTPDSLGQLYLACNGLIPSSAQNALLQPSSAAEDHDIIRDFYDQQFAALGDMPNREKTAHLLLRLNLESLLSRLDSATMLESLEARVPYTDHVLVEQVFRLPHRFRIDVCPSEESPWRSSLELAQRGSLRPKRVIHSAASRHLPSRLAQRPKASFPTPLPIWLQHHWKDWLEEKMLDSVVAREIFLPQSLRQLADLPPQMSMWKWPVANIVLWGERCFG